MKGYLHVYTGNGKGKTTAALGLALRAVGAHKKVFFAQFVKGRSYAEMEAVRKHLPMITIKQFGRSCFIEKEPLAKDIEAAQKGLGEVTEILKSKKYDVIVLDEATIAVYFKLFTISDLLKALKGRCEESEVVITGRYAPEELLREADLVTEMKEVKHYYKNGVKAREGIEY